MFLRQLNQQPERGSITVFFVLFVLIASAAVSYAVYVGRSTEEKIRTDTAADLAALAMAQHGAMGLNMISVNNLAVAGNLHVGAAVPFIGRYYSLMKALNLDSQNSDDMEQYGKLNSDTEADGSDYGWGFDFTKDTTGKFIKNAAGITTINIAIAKHWLKGGLVKGVEQLRLNKPGDVGLMFQASTANSAGSALNFYNMKFKNLALSTPKQTMCQTVMSSDGLKDRNLSSFWLGGVLISIDVGEGPISAIKTVEGLLQSVGGAVEDQKGQAIAKLESDVRTETGGLSCGDDFDELPWAKRERAEKDCHQIDEMQKAKPGSFFPQFTGCGITDAGDFATQFENFAKAKTSEKHAIGFVFADVQGSNVKSYEDSLQFAAAVGNPMYLFGELPNQKNAADGKSTTCPPSWKVEINGHQYCSLMLDGIDFASASNNAEPEDIDLASGGVGRAVGANGGQGKGKLNGIWSRVQWSFSQAKAEYEPGEGDPREAELKDQYHFDNVNERANKRRMQFFWPAWKARSAEPTVLGSVLKLLGNH